MRRGVRVIELVEPKRFAARTQPVPEPRLGGVVVAMREHGLTARTCTCTAAGPRATRTWSGTTARQL
ncbi:MAG: hypothetical protein J2P20_02640 [Pseudonocardia sp.]|nr:hypothetical protein [Pseudonocardia sp.]MBO0877511.1 hypothetical protein [Pseudonocardia sp.]